jgi:hypothetical protein
MDKILQRIVRDKITGCWVWNGAKDSSGYGMVSRYGKRIRVHRISAEHYLGLPVNDKRVVLHLCDNPSCCNPAHLKGGTQKDNMVDCSEKGRTANLKKTHCKRGHLLDGDNLYVCKSSNGRPMRVCRACRKEYIRYYMRRERSSSLPNNPPV